MENPTPDTNSSNFLDISTFNNLKKAMGNNFNILIDAFITSLDEQLEKTPKLIESKDLKSYVREVHSMKSASANFGFNEFSTLNRQLEMNGAKEGQFPSEDELTKLTQQVNKIKQWLADNPQ